MLALEQKNLFSYFGIAGRSSGESALADELKSIIERQAISVVFQPVVSLSGGEVIGYEALSRGPQGSPLERPDALFAVAAKHDLTWELEYLCRTKALEIAKDIIASKKLFLNVDPKIIKDSRFHKGHTREMLQQLYADAGNIIFEITEKTAIADYQSFRRILDNYISQGYKIAIDDTGAGYSGLKTLAQIRPHFIKVDMDLVRDIDKDSLKQAMLKALYDFSVSTSSQIIAEGIETLSELETLISLGIPYGQGYFLQRPQPGFGDISPDLRRTIKSRTRRKGRTSRRTCQAMAIGEIAQQASAIGGEQRVGEVIDQLADYPHTQGVAVVDNGRTIGLLMKAKLLAGLAGGYGKALYMNKPVRLLMAGGPLILDYATPLDVAAKSALARREEDIYDHIIVEKEGHYYGIATVKAIMDKIMRSPG
jgi:EAL domain-containing protein (putative c-di-GMP-specific phosphodiesterase class I)